MKGSSRDQSSSYWGVPIREEGERAHMQKQERSKVNTWSPGMPFTPGEPHWPPPRGRRVPFTCVQPKDINIRQFFKLWQNTHNIKISTLVP